MAWIYAALAISSISMFVDPAMAEHYSALKSWPGFEHDSNIVMQNADQGLCLAVQYQLNGKFILEGRYTWRNQPQWTAPFKPIAWHPLSKFERNEFLSNDAVITAHEGAQPMDRKAIDNAKSHVSDDATSTVEIAKIPEASGGHSISIYRLHYASDFDPNPAMDEYNENAEFYIGLSSHPIKVKPSVNNGTRPISGYFVYQDGIYSYGYNSRRWSGSKRLSYDQQMIRVGRVSHIDIEADEDACEFAFIRGKR